MSKWIEKELGKLFSYEQPYRYIVENTEYDKNSGTPVLTAGKSFVLGYTKETDNIYMDLPVVIFDDFTTDCKYVDFPFKVKSSAMKFLKSNDDNRYYLPLLFAYLETLKLSEIGEHKRQWLSEYASKTICLPEDIEEQKRIAAVLTKADELIDATQELIDNQKKIKIGLMQTLLTCGIDKNGVIRSPKTHKFKDSELGPIPEEWECVELGSYSKSIADGDHMPPPKVEYGIPFVTIGNVKNESIDFSNTMYVGYDYFSSIDIKRKPQKGDVLYTVVASFGIPILMKNDQDFVFQRHIAIIRPKEDFKSEFLFYYLKSEAALKQADDSAVGVAQRTISLTSLRAYKVVKPSLAEQDCIVSILQQQDQIIKDLELEKQKYIDIKKGLMADLLSGKVKVSA